MTEIVRKGREVSVCVFFGGGLLSEGRVSEETGRKWGRGLMDLVDVLGEAFGSNIEVVWDCGEYFLVPVEYRYCGQLLEGVIIGGDDISF